MLNGRSIAITGGTGSLGKKLTHVILKKYKPSKLIIFSRDELKQFEMSQRWSKKKYQCIHYILGDVRDKESIGQALKGVDYLIHAAALKQVPAAEYNPKEFIKTNIIGAINVIDAALYNKVKKVVSISTDKACNPINLYGATKLCSDKLFVAADGYNDISDRTIFCVARYGNVVGSRGSVVPFFEECAKTGILPITDTRMTRFWITLDQCVDFVLKVLDLAKGREIFIPKIPSMKIIDLARAIAPECEHQIIGIRPGEKIHETLIGKSEGRYTIEYDNYYIVNNQIENNDFLLSNNSQKGRPCLEGFSYNSDNNPHKIGKDFLRNILNYISDDYSIEKTRWSLEEIKN